MYEDIPQYLLDVIDSDYDGGRILILEAYMLLIVASCFDIEDMVCEWFCDNMGALLSIVKGYSRNAQLREVIGEFLKLTQGSP